MRFEDPETDHPGMVFTGEREGVIYHARMIYTVTCGGSIAVRYHTFPFLGRVALSHISFFSIFSPFRFPLSRGSSNVSFV